jgi:hypothetical protein
VPLAVKEALERETSASPGEPPPAALRLPLACGPPRAAVDSEGAPSTVVDVVYAADVAKAAVSDVRLKAFVIGTALSHVGAKHGWALDEKYKLPRRKYFDEPVRAQRVRADGAGGAGPKITELPSDDDAAAQAPSVAPPRTQPRATITEVEEEEPSFALRVAPAPKPAAGKAAAPAPAAAPRTPAAVVAAPAAAAAAAGGASAAHTLSFEGRPCAAMLARVALPPSAAARSADVRATLRRGELLLELPPPRGAPAGAPATRIAAVQLPFEADARTASAWLADEADESAAASAAPRKQVVLHARLPVRPYRDVAQEAATAAARGAGALDLSAAAYLELID